MFLPNNEEKYNFNFLTPNSDETRSSAFQKKLLKL